MVSIVVCSVRPDYFNRLCQSIEATIGISDYEIILIDNAIDNKSISTAYNHGILKSKNDIICLVHEDVIFHTANWGALLISIFQENKDLGLLGVAGSSLKLKTPSSWFNVPEKFHYKNIIQHSPDGSIKHESIGWNLSGNSIKNAACIDGVFMAIRKSSDVFFNEKLTGFHGYDITYSLACHAKNLEVSVTNQILIEHYSMGSINKAWYKAMDFICNEYEKTLPLNKTGENNIEELELKNLTSFIHGCFDKGLKSIGLKYMMWFFSYKPFSLVNFVFIKRFLYR